MPRGGVSMLRLPDRSLIHAALRYRMSMMRALAQALVLLVALVSVPTSGQDEDRSSEAMQDPAQYLSARNSSHLDPALPELPFEDWLLSLLPPGTTLVYEDSDCGEQTGDPSIDADRDIPKCLSVYTNVVSRAREMELLFDEDGAIYRGGAVFAAELEGIIRVARLSELERALKKPLRPYPLVCPSGTTLKLREEYAGVYEWCEDGQGKKQGPYRSWFSTGIYLMQMGAYKDDARFGPWIECNRFERCESKDYVPMGK